MIERDNIVMFEDGESVPDAVFAYTNGRPFLELADIIEVGDAADGASRAWFLSDVANNYVGAWCGTERWSVDAVFAKARVYLEEKGMPIKQVDPIDEAAAQVAEDVVAKRREELLEELSDRRAGIEETLSVAHELAREHVGGSIRLVKHLIGALAELDRTGIHRDGLRTSGEDPFLPLSPFSPPRAEEADMRLLRKVELLDPNVLASVLRDLAAQCAERGGGPIGGCDDCEPSVVVVNRVPPSYAEWSDPQRHELLLLTVVHARGCPHLHRVNHSLRNGPA